MKTKSYLKFPPGRFTLKKISEFNPMPASTMHLRIQEALSTKVITNVGTERVGRGRPRKVYELCSAPFVNVDTFTSNSTSPSQDSSQQ